MGGWEERAPYGEGWRGVGVVQWVGDASGSLCTWKEKEGGEGEGVVWWGGGRVSGWVGQVSGQVGGATACMCEGLGE